MTRRRALTLVGAVVLPAAVAYLAVLLLATGSRLAVVVDDVGNFVSPLLATAACADAAHRCAGRLRRSWALLGAFSLTWAAGQAAWCWYELVLVRPVPFPGWPDVGYLLSVPFAVAGLLAHPYAPRPVAGRLRLLTDGLLVGLSLLALAWRVSVGEVFRGSGGTGPAQVLGVAYPALDVVLVTVLLLLLARAGSRARSPLLLTAGALVLGALGHLAYGLLAQAAAWVPGGPVDAAWGWGFLLLATAAVVQRSAPADPERDGGGVVLGAVLPYLPVVVLVVVAVADRVTGRAADPVQGALLAAVLVTVCVRQAMAMVADGRHRADLESLVRQRTAALRRLADTDPLTGLPNRNVLLARIEAARVAGPVAVLLLDLDGFKAVNDTLGHAAGDALLVQVAERMSRALRPGWTAARLGGDEFSVVLPDPGGPVEALGAADLLLEALAGPLLLDGRTVEVRASVGVVRSEPGDTAADLLQHADLAMYAAKDEGRSRRGRAGTAQLFVPSLRDALLAQVDLERDLRAALAVGAVVPHYQPVVDLATGRVVGVEALARWTGTDGRSVPPSVFVPLAERCGLVEQLGRAVLHAACREVGGWRAPLELSVNVSAVQLTSGDLVDDVRDALREGGLPSSALVLEITETAVVDDLESAAERLEELRALGVRIALDDFGTGYSALGVLQRLPVDVVKIDRAFVHEVHLGPRQGALAAAVMTLAGSLGLTVVAEGVELPEQASRLAELGCHLVQGHLFSPALPGPQLLRLLRDGSRVPQPRRSAVLR